MSSTSPGRCHRCLEILTPNHFYQHIIRDTIRHRETWFWLCPTCEEVVQDLEQQAGLYRDYGKR